MLLNLSHHPSSNWPENQKVTALALYGEVTDLPFPQIPPDLDSDSLELWVKQFESQILAIVPKAVHIMGEMTFTFRLVNRLKAKGILCLASTTERISEEKEGVKTSVFRFVQFREY